MWERGRRLLGMLCIWRGAPDWPEGPPAPGTHGPGVDKPALMKSFLHSLSIYQLGKQPFGLYIFFNTSVLQVSPERL